MNIVRKEITAMCRSRL